MRIAIVGTGYAGLACGYELQAMGHEVQAFEKASYLGGRGATRQGDICPFDVGAQYFSTAYHMAKEYSERLGLEELWQELSPATHHVYYQGELYDASLNGLTDYLFLRYLSPKARVRLLAFYSRMLARGKALDFFDLCTLPEELDKESLADLSLRWAGLEATQLALDSFIGGYHFHRSEELSLGAFLAVLQSFGEDFRYYHTAGGISRIAEELAKHFPIHLNTPIANAEDLLADFDEVVLATDAKSAAAICPSLSLKARELIEQVRYAPTISVGYAVPKSLVAHLGMVIIPFVDNQVISAYINQAAKYDVENETILTLFLWQEAAKELLPLADEEVFAKVGQELAKVSPVPLEKITLYMLQKHPTAMPIFYPGYCTRVKRYLEEESSSPFHLCGDYLNSPWVEGALRIGKKIAARVGKTQSEEARREIGVAQGASEGR